MLLCLVDQLPDVCLRTDRRRPGQHNYHRQSSVEAVPDYLCLQWLGFDLEAREWKLLYYYDKHERHRYLSDVVLRVHHDYDNPLCDAVSHAGEECCGRTGVGCYD
jgi:hypothetical protein